MGVREGELAKGNKRECGEGEDDGGQEQGVKGCIELAIERDVQTSANNVTRDSGCERDDAYAR